MSTSLLKLPSELLTWILALLPTRDMFKFSQCSRFARCLANSTFHTLNLDFCPPPYRKDFYLTPPRITPSRLTNNTPPLLGTLTRAYHSPSCRIQSSKTPIKYSMDKASPHKMLVSVRDAQFCDYETWINFHSAFLPCMLARYQNIQNLDISVWTFTVPMAKAIPKLERIRTLSITIQETMHARTAQRNYAALQSAAWHVLATSSDWNDNISELKIENVDMQEPQLAKLIAHAPKCQTLKITKYASVGTSLWDILGEEWHGRDTVRSLAVVDCGAVLGESTLKALENMKALQHLDLHGCFGLDAEDIREYNSRIWNISTMILPGNPAEPSSGLLEVDTDCDSDDEEYFA